MTRGLVTTDALLASIPDWSDWPELDAWLQTGRQQAARIIAGPEHEVVAVDGRAIASAYSPSVFGRYAQRTWRRFAAAVFLADLTCYATAADQVNFERLLLVLHAFPAGFRIWGILSPQGVWLPVGYSGWYPVAEASFAQLERADPLLANRLVVPLSHAVPNECYLYLFNYSLAAPLHRSKYSRSLLRALAADVRGVAPRGMATITVSPDGIRVAERFGLKASGTLLFDGLAESVLTARFAAAAAIS